MIREIVVLIFFPQGASYTFHFMGVYTILKLFEWICVLKKNVLDS